MSRPFLLGWMLVMGIPGARAADPPAAVATPARTLWNKLIDVTLDHVRTGGPDSDVAQFVSMAREAAWARRTEFVVAVTPFLADANPKRVAGAIEVLYRMRAYRPSSWIGSGDDTFEKKHAAFFAQLDRHVHAGLAHFQRLNDGTVFQQLALFLGVAPSREAKAELLRLARETPAREQALICLAWHRDPEDMKDLLPFMLEDSPAASALPYHFRNSYGRAALPHLKRAVAEAKSEFARRSAREELDRLEASK
jgi:hypothetical protein